MPASPNGLRASAALVIGFGLLMAAGTLPPLNGVLDALADTIFWPMDGVQSARTDSARLLTAICGGLAVGWGVLIWGLTGRLFASDPETVRRLVLRGYGAWFLADGAASILAGAPLNLVGNALFLLAMWWPIRRSLAEPSGT